LTECEQTTFEAPDASTTGSLGEALGRLVAPGDMLVISGELGAGKTTFVQGLARGLDVGDQVHSPTFTFIHLHQGRIPLVHADLYRVADADELADLGLAELLYSDAVVAVEWGERFEPFFSPGSLDIEILYGTGEEASAPEHRTIRARANGGSAQRLLARWVKTCSA
jgi:tRNA threonylcarbamoyladenosine biosynthesis protein TsaE